MVIGHIVTAFIYSNIEKKPFARGLLYSLFTSISFIVIALALLQLNITSNLTTITIFFGLLFISQLIFVKLFPQWDSKTIMRTIVINSIALTVMFKFLIIFSILVVFGLM